MMVDLILTALSNKKDSDFSLSAPLRKSYKPVQNPTTKKMTNEFAVDIVCICVKSNERYLFEKRKYLLPKEHDLKLDNDFSQNHAHSVATYGRFF